jgi:hypothetical protein
MDGNKKSDFRTLGVKTWFKTQKSRANFAARIMEREFRLKNALATVGLCEIACHCA